MKHLHFLVLASLVQLLVPASSARATDIYVDSQIVVRLNPGYTIDQVNQTWDTVTLDAYPQGNLYLVGYYGPVYLDDLDEQMAMDPMIQEAEVNYVQETPEGIRQMVISGTGNGFEEYADQAVTHRIGLDFAHQVSTGSGVLVAVLDTGVDFGHPALAGRLSPNGYDFVDDDPDPSDSANGVDDDVDGLTDEGYGHGTMVAGIVALVAPDAVILPIRVLDDEALGNAYQICKAIHYAQSQGAQIINMSFGVPRRISTIANQITIADYAGLTIVSGAGNENSPNPPYFPGDHSKTIMVTAVGPGDVKAPFADFNSAVDLSAPGEAILSAFPGGGYASGSGCSFAVPFVAGEAALIKAQDPALTPLQVEYRIQGAVIPTDNIPGNGYFAGEMGSGRVYLPFALGMTTGIGGGDSGVPALLVSANPARGPVSFRAPDPSAGSVTLRVHDAQGRLLHREQGDASAPFTWHGRDDHGRTVPAGRYFARLVDAAGRSVAGAPFVLLR